MKLYRDEVGDIIAYSARERGEQLGLRVVPPEPGPEFRAGPRVPKSWRVRFAQLVKLLKERGHGR